MSNLKLKSMTKEFNALNEEAVRLELENHEDFNIYNEDVEDIEGIKNFTDDGFYENNKYYKITSRKQKIDELNGDMNISYIDWLHPKNYNTKLPLTKETSVAIVDNLFKNIELALKKISEISEYSFLSENVVSKMKINFNLDFEVVKDWLRENNNENISVFWGIFIDKLNSESDKIVKLTSSNLSLNIWKTILLYIQEWIEITKNVFVEYPLALYLPLHAIYKKMNNDFYHFTIMGSSNDIGLDDKRNFLLSNINRDIKALGVNVAFTAVFENWIKDLPFYINGERWKKIFKEINILDVDVNKKGFHPLFDMPIMDKNDYLKNLNGVISVVEWMVEKDGLDEKEASRLFENYLLKNRSVIKKVSEIRYSKREGLMSLIRSPELFWCFYFMEMHSFEHRYKHSTGTEDAILTAFYSIGVLEDDSLNWRIPEEYVIKITGENNIVKSMITFADRGKNVGSVFWKGLYNILKQNNIVLLDGIMHGSSYKKLLLDAGLSSGINFRDLFEKEKKWWNIFSYESRVEKNYEVVGTGCVRFKPILESNQNAVSTEPQIIKEDNELLVMWGVPEMGLKQDMYICVKELAQKVCDARTFLNDYPVYSESSDFIKNRVDHYVVQFLSNYQNDKKKQEAIKKISEIPLMVNLDEELKKHLNVLKGQIQVCIDNIVSEVQSDVEFETQKMGIFLENRFPEVAQPNNREEKIENTIVIDGKGIIGHYAKNFS